jgi:hypothetical protein
LKYYSEAYDPIVSKILDRYAISFDDIGLYGGMLVAYWVIYNFVALTILLLKRSNWKLWKKIKTKLFSRCQNVCFFSEHLVASAIPVTRKSSKNLSPQEVEMSASAGLLKHGAGTQSTSGSGSGEGDDNNKTRGLKVEHHENDVENHASPFSSPTKGGGGGGGSQRQMMSTNPQTAPEPIGFETYPIPPGHEKYQDVI